MTVIWDWNGTILNDVDLCFDILNNMLKDNNKKCIDKVDDYKEIFDFPIIDYYKRAGFDFSKTSFEDLAEIYMAQYRAKCADCTLQPFVVDAIKNFNSQGINQVILSASDKSDLLRQVPPYGIATYFSDFIGLDNIYAKSKVQAGLDWIKKSGINPKDAVMIGDTTHDAQVANALSVKCLLFSGGHHPAQKLLGTGHSVFDDYLNLSNFI